MRSLAAAAVCVALLAPACVRGEDARSGEAAVTVVTGAYPFRFLVERLGGERVRVVDVAPPGAEPHDIELTPAQVGQVEQADLVVLAAGFQPALDDAAPDAATVDLAEGAADPHVWQDPGLFQVKASMLVERLILADRAGEPGYRERQEALAVDLTALDEDLARRLGGCRGRHLVTEHAAFAEFARAYGLAASAIAGVDPEAEPSPRRLADVAAFVRKNRVRAVFAESADSRAARTVAREAGVPVEVLDPVETFRGADYPTAMRRNADTVARALGCA